MRCYASSRADRALLERAGSCKTTDGGRAQIVGPGHVGLQFARSEALGWLAALLAALAALAFSGIIVREAWGLWRLHAIEELRRRGGETLVSDDRVAGRAVVRDVLALSRRMPRLARAHALPFAVLRVISDEAGTALPEAVEVALDGEGGVNLGRVIRSLIARPHQLPALVRAASDSPPWGAAAGSPSHAANPSGSLRD